MCFGVFQHLSSRSACQRIVVEIGRVLRPGGEAFVQLPVLAAGPRARLWRTGRFAGLRILGVSRGYYGVRLTRREWARAFAKAELRVEAQVERDGDPTLISRYPHAHDTRMRLRRR